MPFGRRTKIFKVCETISLSYRMREQPEMRDWEISSLAETFAEQLLSKESNSAATEDVLTIAKTLVEDFGWN